jgi:hypothetical protein
MHLPGFIVWCGVISRSVTGPCFFEKINTHFTHLNIPQVALCQPFFNCMGMRNFIFNKMAQQNLTIGTSLKCFQADGRMMTKFGFIPMFT